MNYMPDARRELSAILEAIVVVVVCWRWRWTSGEITRTASSDYFSHATFNCQLLETDDPSAFPHIQSHTSQPQTRPLTSSTPRRP